jgi:hypothetical protein
VVVVAEPTYLLNLLVNSRGHDIASQVNADCLAVLASDTDSDLRTNEFASFVFFLFIQNAEFSGRKFILEKKVYTEVILRNMIENIGMN